MKIKFSFFYILAFFLTSSSVLGQTALTKADSLFGAKKYTEALDIYEEIFESGQASPSMLLKMAFIEEGLENYVDALYHLNLYYIKSGNKKVLVKMQEIAEANELEGYEFSDEDFILNMINKYKLYIQAGMLLCAMLLFVYIIRKFKKQESARLPLFFQVILLTILFLFNNEMFSTDRAIIVDDHTLLRSAPSAAAEPLESIKKGHRVRVLEQSEIWVKIEWNEQFAYLRKGRIRLI